jgi:heptosyltransferase-3
MAGSKIWCDATCARISLQVMRILFIGPSRIGDTVLASGVLSHLIATYPDARFTVACGAAAAPLYEAMPCLERLIPIHKLSRGRHWWRLWKQVSGTRWSMVVDVRRSVIPWTVLTARRAVAPSSSSHQEDHAVVAFARTLGLADLPPAPSLWSATSHAAKARELIPDGAPVLAIGPTANWPRKIWPVDRYLEVANRISAPDGVGADAFMKGARIAVFGAAGEREIAQPLIDAIPPDRRIDLVGNVDLPTVSACMQHCALYIGNDSGLMHMAAASGVPALGLFGPSRPERYAPWGLQTAWVKTQKSYEELMGVPNSYDPSTGSLMESLSVDYVVSAALELWQRSGSNV